jgi:hypothetical protein
VLEQRISLTSCENLGSLGKPSTESDAVTDRMPRQAKLKFS